VRLWHAAIDVNARSRKAEVEMDIPGTPAALDEQADALWQYGRTKEAERAYAEAEARLEKLAATFPDSPGLQQEMIRSLLSRSLLLQQTGRPQEAGPLRERAHQLYRNLSPNDQQTLIWEFTERGRKLSVISNLWQAERVYSQALALAPEDARLWFRRAAVNRDLGQWDNAIADFAKVVELVPTSAVEHNNLAWFLVTCPDPKFRDPAKAVKLAQKAVDMAPKEGSHWNTLGVAHYRAGDWKAATAALEKSDELLKGNELSFNAFFLAMAQWQLANKDEARRRYDQAVQWMEKNKPQDEELRRFRAEAEDVLKIEKKPMPK